MERSVYRKMIAFLPALVVGLSLLHLLPFLLPDVRDNLSESYEPAKTLHFIAMHGAYVHKWGPVPAFIFAPVYAVVLLISKLGGHLSQFSGVYPFGFDNAEVQIGHMLLAARATVFIVGLISIYYLCLSLQRALKDVFSPVIALMVCLSTSLIFLVTLVDTKPDGLMVSMLICALANYASIVLDGITAGRAIRLGLFYVASVSCKELTSTTLFLPFLGLLIVAIGQWRSGNAEGRLYVRRLMMLVVSIPVFYLLLNVVYAPSMWKFRIAYVFGPLKDPHTWAAPGQTRLSYLRDTGAAVFAAIGWGGLLMLALTLVLTVRRPSQKLILLWLPFLSHLLFTTLLGGYMPAYFMLPLTPAVALPAAYALHQLLAPALESPALESPVFERHASTRRLQVGVAVLWIVCLYMALSATTLFQAAHPDGMAKQAMEKQVQPGSTVDYLKVMSVPHPVPTPGPLGETVDHRPLYEVIQSPISDRPEYALIPTDLEKWTMDIKDLPSRAAFVKLDTNYDYSNFRSFDSIGYELAGTTVPAIPAWLFPQLIAGHSAYTGENIHIYQLRPVSGGR
jgi:hypothetical protein